MKLDVLGDYRNDGRGLVFQKGETIEVDVPVAAFLMADSPGTFVEHKPATANKRVETKGK